ncbi:MAG: NAD(P)-dependent oxidoreductase [Erysipelotrichaceae bacterium]|nr:NAD(P)-dependent oxidoreductase [Erysipelotrichaceae bacterium]
MSAVLQQDFSGLLERRDIDWDYFRNSSFLITGATGLIGSLLARLLIEFSERKEGNVSVTVLVRDRKKAEELFSGYPQVRYLIGSVEEGISEDNFDFVVHCASPTRSKLFVEKPVETIDTIVMGTGRILNSLKDSKRLKKFMYLSSMESYGVLDDGEVTEEKQGYIDPLNVRSSYSLGKRMAELYTHSYGEEYGINTAIARLAMTFGAGIPASDNRVVKYFCDCAVKGEDIVIRSTGRTVVNMVYTADALAGILVLLQKGENGQAYNIVCDNSGVTIADMANEVAAISDKKISVRYEQASSANGFAPDNTMVLNGKKIRELGWKAEHGFHDALERTYQYEREQLGE